MENLMEFDDSYYHGEEKYYVNKRTGEKIAKSQLELLPETHTYKTKKLEAIQNNELQGGYFHLITRWGTDLIKRFDVSFEDLGRLFMLFTYGSYRETKSGKMYLKYHDNVHYFDNRKLQEVLKLSAEQTRQFKKRIKEKGILNEDEKGMYFTDDVIIRGRIYPTEQKHMNYFRVYDEPLRDLYNLIVQNGRIRTAKGVGVLLCLIPFMQKNKNVISSMYYDELEERYRPMSLSQIAEVLHMDRKVLSRNIDSMNDTLMTKIGEPLVYDVTVKPFGKSGNRYKKSGLVINPKFSYSSTSKEYTQLIEEIEKMVITSPEITM